MALRHPFAAYNASSNLEAHFVCGLLQAAGIEAMVIEDGSQAGLWFGGTIPEIHRPQVWIEQADIERVRPILTDYDRRNADRCREVDDGNPPAWRWFAPWSWGSDELRRVAVWAVIVVMILWFVAPMFLPAILQIVGDVW